MTEFPDWIFIVCPLVYFAAGIMSAISGGGGLITLPSLVLCGLPPHLALGTNKFAATIGSLSAVAGFMRKKCIVWKVAPAGTVASFAGAVCGASLALTFDNSQLGRIMVFALPAVMLMTLAGGGLKLTEGELPDRFLHLKVFVVTGLIGLYDGFLGPGAGAFFVIVLHKVFRVGLVRASGTAKVYNLASTLGSLCTFAAAGSVFYLLAIPCALGSIVGNLLGVHIAVKSGARLVRGFLYAVMVALTGALAFRYLL